MAKSGLAGFSSVQTGGPVWEPKQTGSKKGGDLKALQPSDESYLIGWYLGTKEGIGKNNSKLHEFKMKEVGNDSHINGELGEDRKVGIWGSSVLDNIIAEKVQIGQPVAIVWKGLQPTKDGSATFHNWDVLENPSLEPLSLDGLPTMGAQADIPQTNAAPTPVNAEAAIMDDEDDDLPF